VDFAGAEVEGCAVESADAVVVLMDVVGVEDGYRLSAISYQLSAARLSETDS